MTGKPLSELRVLDSGRDEGQFAIEFASRGAQVVGIEGRAVSAERARESARGPSVSRSKSSPATSASSPKNGSGLRRGAVSWLA